MSEADNLVPPRETFAHVMTVVDPAPSLDEWRRTCVKIVKHLEEKHDKPLREILEECGKDREPKFPRPPRSD